MRKLFLLVGAATMAVSVPAAAKPGQGGGHGHGGMGANVHAGMGHGHGAMNAGMRAGLDRDRDDVRTDVRTRMQTRTRMDRTRMDRSGRRYGGQACPPGLAKKTPACVPPGQARAAFAAGSRLPVQYNYVPVPSQYLNDPRYSDIFSRYDPSQYRYYYDNGTTDRAYIVDPRTRIIRQVIDLIR